MTELLHDIDAPSDAELISRVRGGDVAAYGELFSRHVDAARRLARQLVRGPDADDLVSDAFAKVLGVLQGGGGPDVAFRAYLLTAVRRLHVDRIRAGAKLQTSDDMEAFDAGVPFQDTAVAAFESGAAAKAFASLPERWQLVLWHLEVEGQRPADIAPLLGMSANSVSALAYRAREGLRQAFLTMHLNDISDTSCRWVNEHLGAYVRNGLAKRDAAKVQSHLDECRRCTAMYLELTEVNSNLRGIIAPLLLGAAAAGYLSSTGAAAGGGFGLVSMMGRVRDAVSANAGAVTAGAVAAGVAAVATAGIMLLPSSGPDDTVTGADDPIGQVITPGEPGGDSPGSGREDGADPADDEAGENGTAGETGEDGTAGSEEPALDANPESVPVGEAGTGTAGDGGTGSETGGGTGGGSPDGESDPNQPPGQQP
ncbi:MAG: sigma-70 family RNA polymerase sigma factor, partial [Actinomycetes bacterium]